MKTEISQREQELHRQINVLMKQRDDLSAALTRILDGAVEDMRLAPTMSVKTAYETNGQSRQQAIDALRQANKL